VDRAPLREGRVVGRMWVAALGGETLYEVDLPSCCRRTAWGVEDSFDCPGCGAAWQAPLPFEPEECAFVERTGEGERKGAA
jgi:DNA-binding helix-hairpin-helix protein with protein kinase domain